MQANGESNQMSYCTAAAMLQVSLNNPDSEDITTWQVDKSALQALYDTHKNKQQGNYTVASWGVFTSALAAAETVLDDDEATQEQVDAAKAALQRA